MARSDEIGILPVSYIKTLLRVGLQISKYVPVILSLVSQLPCLWTSDPVTILFSPLVTGCQFRWVPVRPVGTEVKVLQHLFIKKYICVIVTIAFHHGANFFTASFNLFSCYANSCISCYKQTNFQLTFPVTTVFPDIFQD